jgi:hypothetical protein
MRREVVTVIVLFVAISWTTEVQAQTRLDGRSVQSLVTPDAPHREFGLSVSEWNWNGGSWLVNGRLTRNLASWFAVEGALEHGRADYLHARYGMFIVNARLRSPHASEGTHFFVEAGGVAGVGLNYGASPMIGYGLQSASKAQTVAGRAEIQIFPRGEALRDHTRLLLGLVILIR